LIDRQYPDFDSKTRQIKPVSVATTTHLGFLTFTSEGLPY
jgi:hypothetical protein